MNTAELESVVSADSMDISIFAKHMNYRHAESLGGLEELVLPREGDVSQAYRAFHRTLHRLRSDGQSHEHSEFKA